MKTEKENIKEQINNMKRQGEQINNMKRQGREDQGYDQVSMWVCLTLEMPINTSVSTMYTISSVYLLIIIMKSKKRREHCKEVGFKRGRSRGRLLRSAATPGEDSAATSGCHGDNSDVYDEAASPVAATPASATPAKRQRLSQEQFDLIYKYSPAEKTIDAYDTSNEPLLTKTLRPRKPEKQQQITLDPVTDNSMLKFHVPSLTAKMFNTCFKEHLEYSPGCLGGLQYHVVSEKKQGLVWEHKLHCDHCDYISSSHHKTFTTTSTLHGGCKTRGQSMAEANIRACLAVNETSMGFTQAERFFAVLGASFLSKNAFQKLYNRVCQRTIECNEDSMKQYIQLVKDVNKAKGLPEDSAVNVEVDTRYSSPLFVHNKPMQGSSSATTLFIENQTPRKYVVSIEHRTQLCPGRRRGLCPSHADCMANVSLEETVSQEKVAAKLATEKSGLQVEHATTDLSCQTADGVEEACGKEVTSQFCHAHLKRAHIRRIMNAKLKKSTFCAKTEEERKTRQNRFAYELANRCRAEFLAAYQRHFGKLNFKEHMITSIQHASDAVLACYTGQCTQVCKDKSMVCAGDKKVHFKRDMYAAENFDNILLPDAADTETLRNLISFVMSRTSVQSSYLNLSTQKAEACNRAIISVLPKCAVYQRNEKAKVHSVIHAVNEGRGKSIKKKLAAFDIHVPERSRVDIKLDKLQKDQMYQRLRQASQAYRTRRAILRAQLYKVHNKIRQDRTYQRDVRAAQVAAASKKQFHEDHPYTRKKKVRRSPRK
jgi:hypothetical protein